MAFWFHLHTRFFYTSNTFISNARLKLPKNQANTKQHHEAENAILLFENFSHSSSTLSSETIGYILKTKQRNKCAYVYKIMRLIIMKMKMKIKNRSHRYDINRPRPRHGHKYSKYKKCLSMMILICMYLYLSNLWGSIHEKVKEHWGWAEKKWCL